jgi:hypothetical protein
MSYNAWVHRLLRSRRVRDPIVIMYVYSLRFMYSGLPLLGQLWPFQAGYDTYSDTQLSASMIVPSLYYCIIF